MTDLFTISAEYGQWGDHTEVHMFNTTDETQAREMLDRLAAEIAGVYAEVRDRMAYNGDRSFEGLLGSEAVVNVAQRAHWDEGPTLFLYKQPMGVVHADGRESIDSRGVSFIPDLYRDEDDFMDRGADEGISVFEMLAESYEKTFEGWKHA